MRLLPLLSGALLIPIIASAQSTVKKYTSLRASPDGVLLATLHAGARLASGRTSGSWTRVTLEGYVYKTGIGGKRDTFAISAASDGVLLRASAGPKGTQLASLKEGMGLVRVGRRGDWLEVRRTAWVKSAALDGEKAGTVANAKAATGSRRPAASGGASESAAAAGSVAGENSGAADATTTSHGELAEASDSTGASGAAASMVTERGTELRNAPGGRGMAALDSNANVSVLARERGWALVRVEGWIPDSVLAPQAGTTLTAISAADLRAEPERYSGQTVRWEVQKIALQVADPLRKGLAPEEPYLLARGPGEEHSLLYLALPPSLVEQARRIEPLGRIMITAKVRTGRSEPSGVPLLDIISIAER